MKAKRDTVVLIQFLYPFVALPLGFLMLTMGWANDQTFLISMGLSVSGIGVLICNIIKEKLLEKPAKRAISNDKDSFFYKNRHKKLALTYA